MERSTGVTLSAVLVFFGSAMALLGGLIGVAALKFAPHGPIPMPTPLFRDALIFDGVLDLAFVGWGIASGVGLIRLQQWARISMLVFSGIMIFFCLIPMVIIPFVPLPPRSETLPSNFALIFRIGTVAFYGLFVALGAFWLYFFSKRSVKDQFKGISAREGLAPESRSQRPLAIVILAWLLIIGGCFTPFALFMRLPAFFFSFAVPGGWGDLVFIAFAAVSLAAGIGLLRLRSWAWLLAVTLQSIGLLNSLSMILIPGAWVRFQGLLQSQRAAMFLPDAPIVVSPALMWIGLGIGALFAGAILVILLAYKRAFDEKSGTPAPAV
ncbi:MAG TPA: hypothetical protein VIY66_12305 [Candidatus Acidoferrales bacterium]